MDSNDDTKFIIIGVSTTNNLNNGEPNETKRRLQSLIKHSLNLSKNI